MAFKIRREAHLRRPADDETVSTVLIPDESAWINAYGPIEAPGEPSHTLVTRISQPCPMIPSHGPTSIVGCTVGGLNGYFL